MPYRNKPASEKAIKLSGNKCIVCGWTKIDSQKNTLLEGAHVRKYEGFQQYDTPENIIALCPNHHTEFDRGNITIDPVHKRCLHRDPKDEFHHQHLAGNISHVPPGNFYHHQKHVFKGKVQ